MKSYNKLADRWGTPQYFAPEMLRKAYGPQVVFPDFVAADWGCAFIQCPCDLTG
jgi:hypothetical protein